MRSLRPADLETLLADLPLVARTYFFEEITSTSDWAKDLVRRAGPGADLHGTLVIANYQTAGRGRFARAWHSPPGRSLLFSLILAPKAGSPASAAEPDSPRPGAFDRLVAVAAPVAVCEAIAERAREPWHHFAPAFPVPAGGMQVERTAELIDFFGMDTILLVGGSLLAAGDALLEQTRKFTESGAEAASTRTR